MVQEHLVNRMGPEEKKDWRQIKAVHEARDRREHHCLLARTEPFIFLGFVLEGITPHVLAKLFAAAVNFTKRLALWKGATRRVRLLRTKYGGCEDGSGDMKAVAIAVGKGGKHCRVWVVQKEGDGCGKRSSVGTVHDQVAAVVCKRRTPFAGVNLIKFNG